MKKAIIYARVSTDEQRDNYSIPSQVGECKKYIEAKGYQLVGNRFVDPVTGFDSVDGIQAFVDDYSSQEENRPALDAAYEYLDLYGFDVVVVLSVDRLDRNIEKFYVHIGQFKPAKVEFVRESFDDNYTGDFMKAVMAAAAKLDNDMRIDRFNRGKRQKARRGYFVSGKPPYGYIKDRNSMGGLAIDPDTAPLIHQVYDLYLNQGLSINAITKVLNEGPFKPRYSDKWNLSSVQKILRNSAYIGKIYYNKNKNIDRKMVKRDRAEWIEIAIPPMIDPMLYERSQALLNENRDIRRRRGKRFYLLSGMVICADCGKLFSGQVQRAGYNRRITDGYFYRHSTTYKHCRNQSIMANVLEPLVWDKVQAILLEPEKMKAGHEKAMELESKTSERSKSRLAELLKERDKLEKKLKNLNTAMIDPDIAMTKAEYIEQRKAIQDQLAGNNELMLQCQVTMTRMPTTGELESLTEYSAMIKDVLINHVDQVTPELKREILRNLNIKVMIHADYSADIFGTIGEIGHAYVNHSQRVNAGNNKTLQPAFHAFGSIIIKKKYQPHAMIQG